MMPEVLVAIGVALLVAMALAIRPIRRHLQGRETQRAIRAFRVQREKLEAKFFDLARVQGKPRGLRWLDCEWQDRVTFGRSTDSRMLTAFVAVNIRFEAIEGGDMEDVAAVDTIRDATALFHIQRGGQWGTGGKALFNMDPDSALQRLEGQFLPVIAKQS